MRHVKSIILRLISCATTNPRTCNIAYHTSNPSPRMPSNVIFSIHAGAYTQSSDDDYIFVEYDCTKTPPFFEGHPSFLEPISRTHKDGRILAIFRRCKVT